MNYFNRAIICLKRNSGKSVALLLLLFVLGNIISGAISIRQAIFNTENNLRAQLPAITAIVIDDEAINHYQETKGEPTIERITQEVVYQISELPYVRSYNFSFEDYVITRGLNRGFIPSVTEGQLDPSISLEDLIQLNGSIKQWSHQDQFERFEIRGVSNANMVELDVGVIVMSDGSPFTQNQIDDGENVALISRAFAEANNLQAGSEINLQSLIFDSRERWEANPNTWFGTQYNEEFLYLENNWKITVAGIFDTSDAFDYSGNIWQTAALEADLQNHIFLPNKLIENISNFNFEPRQTTHVPGWGSESEARVKSSSESGMGFNALFFLEDSREIEAFIEAVTPLLPSFFRIDDLANSFSIVSSSMDSMIWIADIILYGSTALTLVVVSLLVTLFLRDRKHEIGIYLALGEKKMKIILQVLIEVLSVSFIAITLAVFTGNIISNAISEKMLESQIIQKQQDGEFSDNPANQIPWELRIFSTREMSIEEMLDNFDISFDSRIIGTFYAIGLGSIILSTILPIAFIIRLNPKKILV